MWEGLDDNTRDTLVQLPDPAEDAATGLADASWRLMFLEYLAANGADAVIINAVVVLETMHNGQDDLMVLFGMVNTEGTHPVPLSDELYPSLAFPTRSSQDFVLADLNRELVALTDDWWAAFRDEAVRIRHWDAREDLIDEWASHVDENTTEATVEQTAGIAVRSTMTLDEVDRAYVDRLNEYELKELDEGGRVGFQQFEDVVMIGENFPPAYLGAMDAAGTRTKTPTNGTITMVAKGSAFSSGKLSVSYGAPYPDPDSMKVALRRVTKKSISFE
jgi:hypothetical protein